MKKQSTRLSMIACLLCSVLGLARAEALTGQGCNPQLSLELQTMRAADQAVRHESEQAPDDPKILEKMMALDKSYQPRISAILKEYGWPGTDEVGKEGVRSMWTLVQHSSDKVIHEAIPLMQKAADKGELPWAVVALSIDRDLINQGQKQRYGSQFRIEGDRLVALPLEQPEDVDRRRKDVGLNTMEEYRLQLLESYPTLK